MLKEQVGIIPRLNGAVPQTIGGGLCASEVAEIKPGHAEGVLHMSHNGLLNRWDISPLILAHELPDLLIFVVVYFIFDVLRLNRK
jgi:hypothetical protein